MVALVPQAFRHDCAHAFAGFVTLFVRQVAQVSARHCHGE